MYESPECGTVCLMHDLRCMTTNAAGNIAMMNSLQGMLAGS